MILQGRPCKDCSNQQGFIKIRGMPQGTAGGVIMILPLLACSMHITMRTIECQQKHKAPLMQHQDSFSRAQASIVVSHILLYRAGTYYSDLHISWVLTPISHLLHKSSSHWEISFPGTSAGLKGGDTDNTLGETVVKGADAHLLTIGSTLLRGVQLQRAF